MNHFDSFRLYISISALALIFFATQMACGQAEPQISKLPTTARFDHHGERIEDYARDYKPDLAKFKSMDEWAEQAVNARSEEFKLVGAHALGGIPTRAQDPDATKLTNDELDQLRKFGVKMLNSENEGVQIVAARLLGVVQGDVSRKAMMKKLPSAKKEVSRAITESLLKNKFGDNSCVAGLVVVAERAIDTDFLLFKSAVRVMGTIPTPESKLALERLAKKTKTRAETAEINLALDQIEHGSSSR